MSNWISLKKYIPNLQGLCLHTFHSDELIVIEKILRQLNFELYTIDGGQITSKEAFFTEIAKVLKFPSYFGHNWDAWNDCLSDFREQASERSAIIWLEANQTFQHTAQVLLEATYDLRNLALEARQSSENRKPKQIEVFLLGDTAGFKNLT